MYLKLSIFFKQIDLKKYRTFNLGALVQAKLAERLVVSGRGVDRFAADSEVFLSLEYLRQQRSPTGFNNQIILGGLRIKQP